MARGDKARYNQQEQQSFANANKAAQQGYANQQQSYGQAFGGYQNELANPGYSDAEKQAITQAETGSLAGAFGAARTQALNAASRTGNTAGLNATEEELAREQGRENAQAMGGLQQAFGAQRIQGEQNALAGLGNLYGTSTGATGSAMNEAGDLVGTQGRVATAPGFWSQAALAGIKVGGDILGARLGKKG